MRYIVDNGNMRGALLASDEDAGLTIVNALHRAGQTDARLYRAERGIWTYEWLGIWYSYSPRDIPLKVLDLAGEDEKVPAACE